MAEAMAEEPEVWFDEETYRMFTTMAAGVATAVTIALTVGLIAAHLFSFTKPRQQIPIIFILIMCPIFAFTSYAGLLNATAGEVFVTELDSVKECYEAVVIAAFLQLMYGYLGLYEDPAKPIPDAMAKKEVHHSFPLTLFVPSHAPLSVSSLKLLQAFTWQFVLLRPPISLLITFLQSMDMYNGLASYAISTVLQVSIFFAMYALIQFYHSFEEEMRPYNPLAQLLCIKGVVFFAFWQGIVIKTLGAWGYIKGDKHFFFTIGQVEDAQQNFLVCMEMLLFCNAHQFVFSAERYSRAGAAAKEKKRVAEKEEKKETKKEQ